MDSERQQIIEEYRFGDVSKYINSKYPKHQLKLYYCVLDVDEYTAPSMYAYTPINNDIDFKAITDAIELLSEISGRNIAVNQNRFVTRRYDEKSRRQFILDYQI